MKYWVVTRIYLIASVHISRDKKLIAAHPNKITLVGRSVRTKHGRAVDVIVVVFAPCDVIFGHQQAIEILFRGDYRTDVIKVGVDRVSSTIRVCFMKVVNDTLFYYADWVVWHTVQVASNFSNDSWSHTGHLVTVVWFSENLASCLLLLQARYSCMPLDAYIPRCCHRLLSVVDGSMEPRAWNNGPSFTYMLADAPIESQNRSHSSTNSTCVGFQIMLTSRPFLVSPTYV